MRGRLSWSEKVCLYYTWHSFYVLLNFYSPSILQKQTRIKSFTRGKPEKARFYASNTSEEEAIDYTCAQTNR